MSARSKGHLDIPTELRWFLLISLGLWIVSIAYVLVVLFGSYGSHRFPGVIYSRPFSDLDVFFYTLNNLHSPDFFTHGYRWIYPAPCFFLYKLLLLQFFGRVYRPLYADLFYCLVVGCALLFLVVQMVKALEARGLSRRRSMLVTVGAVVLSWPIFFSIRQGNIESLLWIGAAIAVWAALRQKWWMSALIVGLVSSFKIYPLLLLCLFLPRRKYAQTATGILVFALVTLLSLVYVGPTVSIASHNIAAGMATFTDLAFTAEKMDDSFLTYEHSLVSLVRVLTTAHPDYIHSFSSIYYPLVVILGCVLLAILLRKPVVNQLFIIILIIVLLPPKSYDYTLQMLYIPWACLALFSISAMIKGVRLTGLLPTMIVLALVCAPEFFVKYNDYYIFGQFKTICLIVLLVFAIRYRFVDPAEDSKLGGSRSHAIE